MRTPVSEATKVAGVRRLPAEWRIVEIEANIDGLVRPHSFDPAGGERTRRRGSKRELFLSEDIGDRAMVAAVNAPLECDLIAGGIRQRHTFRGRL